MSYPSHGSVVGCAPALGMLLGIACFTSAIVASNICLIAKPHGQKGHPEARQACVPLAKHLASPLLSTPMGGDFSCSFLPFITHPDRRSFLLTALEEFWDHLVFCPITFPLVVSLSALTLTTCELSLLSYLCLTWKEASKAGHGAPARWVTTLLRIEGLLHTSCTLYSYLYIPASWHLPFFSLQQTLSAHWSCQLLPGLWFTVTTDRSLPNCYLFFFSFCLCTLHYFCLNMVLCTCHCLIASCAFSNHTCNLSTEFCPLGFMSSANIITRLHLITQFVNENTKYP